MGRTNADEGRDPAVSSPASRTDGKVLRIGDCRITPTLNRIERGGKTIRIQRLSMDVLLYLAGRAGTVVGYDELLKTLWPRRHAGENAVHRRIAALRGDLGDDAKAPRYIETIPKRGYRLVAPVEWLPEQQSAGGRRNAFRWMLAATAAAGFVFIVTAYLTGHVASRVSLGAPYGTSEPSATAAIAQQRFDLMSSPAGAEVAYRPYGEPETPWQPLGVTPVRSTLPEGSWVLRLIADGHETVEIAVANPGIELNNIGLAPYTVKLPPKGSVPAGMIYVPEDHQPVPLWGYTTKREVGDYYIGRAEVSNAQFAEFVAANGYRERAYWRDLLESEDAIDFAEVARKFTDSTGAPGPAGWIDGRFQPGTADLPVTGVSWYEAMAYARFRGFTLPAAPHWARAALGVAELQKPFAPTLIAAANLGGVGPVPVDDERAMSPLGGLNLIGNAQEWTLSASGNRRLTLGLSFRGQPWGYAMPSMADPLSRLPTQGFRLAKFDEEHFKFRRIAHDGKLPKLPEVSDEAYAQLLATLHYDEGSLDASQVVTVSEVDEGDWFRRKVLIPTKYADDPLPVILFIPKRTHEPLQTLIFLTPGSRGPNSLPSSDTDIRRYQIDFLIESGRALAWPILFGTHERYAGRIELAPTREDRIAARTDEILRHREEVGRLVDYLDASRSFDGDRIGLLAGSAGALYVAPPILAAESRIRSVVFLAGGIAPFAPDAVPLLLNSNSYWPRLTMPFFIASGRYDIGLRFAPPDTVGGTLYEVLGTAEADKRLAVYEMAHWPFPPLLLAEDLLPWLDRYLGPVN